jgi:hypothetical protein
MTTNGEHWNPFAMASPMQAPTNGDVDDSASEMKLRNASPGIFAICPMIRPSIREQNSP